MQASEGENESSQGSSDEEERGASTAPSATTNSGPSSFASRNVGSAGGKDKEDKEEDEEEDEEEGKGTMTRGRRMSSLPLHQRTLRRNIQGRNPRGEGSLDRQLVC
jgi:hypothetical protein